MHEQQQLKVIVDQRERNEDLLSGLEGKGVEIVVDTIPVGDYIVSDRVCIERKTVSDFENSIINGRVFYQLERLREHYALPILILEGSPETFRLDSKVINGTVIAIYIDYGIPVLFAYDADETAELIVNIAKREQIKERREPSLKGGARAYSVKQFQEFVIGNLPGVGPKLAKSLLKHFGSIKKIANASIDELVEVEKIGKKKAETIHNTLNMEYKSEED